MAMQFLALKFLKPCGKLNEQGNTQVDRTNYRLIQTPQVFISGILKEGLFTGISAKFYG